MTQELLGRVHRELLDVLNSINQDKIHHDGDDFHELLNDVEKALAQPEQALCDLAEDGVCETLDCPNHPIEQEPVKWSDYEPDGVHHNKPQKRPQNCGTGYCSCIECVMEPPQRKPLTYCQECMRPNPIDGTDCAHGIKEST